MKCYHCKKEACSAAHKKKYLGTAGSISHTIYLCKNHYNDRLSYETLEEVK